MTEHAPGAGLDLEAIVARCETVTSPVYYFRADALALVAEVRRLTAERDGLWEAVRLARNTLTDVLSTDTPMPAEEVSHA